MVLKVAAFLATISESWLMSIQSNQPYMASTVIELPEAQAPEAQTPDHHSTVERPWRPRINPWIIAMTVTLATFMEVLDSSIANVALPHIAGGLGATQD